MTKKDERKDRGISVKLTPSTKAKLEKVRDALELAHRLTALPGVEPPRVSQAYTVDAALDLLMCVVSEKVEVFEPGAVMSLMILAGVSTGNGVLELMNERGSAIASALVVELGPDGRPWLKGESEAAVPISIELPDAREAAGGMAGGMAEA